MTRGGVGKMALAFGLLLLARPATAQVGEEARSAEPPAARLAIDSRGVQPSIERWLRVELRALGATLAEASETPHVLTLRPRGDGLWVGLDDGATETESELSGSPDPRVAALRVAEWVRAQWLPLAEAQASSAAELETEPDASPDAPAEPAETDAPREPEAASGDEGIASRLELALGGGWSHSVGLAGAARGMLELDVVIARYAMLGVGVRGPFTAIGVSASEGRAEMWLSSAYVAALGALPSIEQLVFVRLGAELGVHWLAVLGRASAPLQSLDVHTAAAHLGARVQVGVALTAWLQLELGLTASASLPQPVLRFAGRDVGAFAEPLLDAWLALRAAP